MWWTKVKNNANAAESQPEQTPPAKALTPRPLMRALEQRIMFDGAAVATAIDIAQHDVAVSNDAAVAVDAVMLSDGDVLAENAALSSQGPPLAGEAAAPQTGPSATQPREIVVIDTSVDDWQSLRDGVPDHAEVILVQPGTNGLQQVADVLRGQTGIDAIHVLSHGDVGSIQLGDTVLNAANAQTYSAELASIGQSLSAGGDVFLYGCYTAQGAEGRSFLGTLATLTGADIAASSDMTASAARGGNWRLEEATGEVASGILASSAWANYSGALTSIPANVTIDFNASGFVESADHGSAVFTQGDFTITYSAANWFQDVDDGQGSSAGLFAGAFSGPETITIQTTSGNEFDFTSFYINTFGGGFASVQGFRDAGSTGTQTTGTGFGQTAGTYTVSMDSSFDNVDRVVITSNSSGFFDIVDSFVLNTANAPPAIANLNGDSVAWAGVGNTVVLDASANASLTDTELEALNSTNGNWNGASLTVQRSTAVAADNFGFNTSGALFSVSGTSASGNLQSGGQTFATYTNTGGVLTVSFTNSGTTPTTALVNDVAQRITYQNNTPAGDATIRFTLHDGTVAGTVANVTVTTDSIYVTNTTDTATINVANGVSFSEAVAIAAADATGSQTIVFDSSLAATALTVNNVSLNESLTFDMDAASGMSLTSGTITLGAATTQTFTNGTSDTASITGVIAGSGALAKAGAGGLTLSATNTYSGATTVSAGTLTVSGGDAIATASSVAVASGATFALSSNETVGNLSGAGAITLGSNTLSTRLTADTTFSGGISGTGGLNVNQTGAATFALTLTGTNTYTGASTLQNFGWLRLDGDASYSSSSALSVNGNSRLTLLSDQTIGSIASSAGTASLVLGSFTLSAGGNNTSTTVAGVISGTGNLVKQGSGTLTVSGTNTYGGTTTVSAGTLSVTSDSNLGSNTVTLAAGSTLDVTGATTIDNAIALSDDATVSNSADATFSGVISGANTLIKTGASTLTLSGTNTYAGTTVSAGTLSVASDANLGSGAVTLASGSTLAITGATNIDNGIVLSGNATVSNSANATLSGVVSGANTLTKAGSSTLTLNNNNTYAGTTVSAGTLSVASDANLGSSTVTLASGSTLEVTGATTIDNAIALTGNATVSNSANATLSGVVSGGFNLAKTGASTLTLSAPNTYGGTTTVSAGTLSLASDSNLGSGTLTLAAGTTLAVTGATTIDNAVTLSGAATVNTTADATLSGNIGGAGSLAKTGANTLTLSGTNSYAGTTTVSAGTLSIASDGNLGSSTVTLATGTTLVVTGATTIDNAIALSGNATVQAANAVTLGGAISGAGGLTKTGAGTVTLSGSNGFTGNVAVSAGGLTLSGGAAIDNNSAVTMSSGTLTLSSSETIGSLAGAGSVALGTNTLTAGGDNTSTSYSGNISGTGGAITKTGAGTLTLSGTNSNTGATTISAGAIDAQNGDAIGNASAVSVASGAFLVLSAAETIGSLAGAGSATLGANTLTTGSNNTTTTFSGAITGSSGMVKTGSGTFTLSNTGNESTLTGGMTISAGTVSISDDDQMAAGTLTLNGGTLSLGGPTVFDNNIDLAASSTINSGGNAIASGVISGAGDLTKTGSLSLQLTNTNTYTGATIVNAGYLLANNANSLGTTAGATTVASGATLYLSGSFTLAEALNLAGTGMLGNGAIYAPSGSSTITGQVTLTGNTTIVQDGDLTFSGGITDGAGSYSLTKQGTGALTLSGTASYDGSTTISSGGLSIGSDSHLGSGALTLATGTTLAVTGATTIDNAIALSGGTATVNTSANTTFSGNITGSGGLTKTGASTLTLSGTDSYTGATNVNTGSLLVNGALTATSNTTVASGASLGGSGSIGSNVTINSGGTLSPGNSAGTLTNNGDLAMASGSILVVEINGATAGTGYDQVIVNGTVDVSGATLSATHGYVAGSGDTYNIIVNDAADAVTGSFSGISEGATVTAGGNSTVLTASYIGATGNDITLTAPVMPVVTSVSSSTPNGSYKIGDIISVSVSFDMSVFVNTGGGIPSLLLETGTVDRTLDYVSGSGSTTLVFDYTVQAGDLSADLDYASTGALVLNGGTIQDALNNNADLTLASPGAANSLGANKALVIDGIVPTASIVVADTALAAGETSTVTITFNEAVTGLDSSDFTVANGTLGTVTTGDGGITWTGTFTPTASIEDTSNLITLTNSAVQDAAGNTGTGATDSNNYAIDNVRPTASIVVADTSLTIGETSLVTITFNEAVTGFTNAALTIANGTLTPISSSDGGITWSATFTASANITDATNLITLDNTGIADVAGNSGIGSTDSNNYAIDMQFPTVASVSVPANATYITGQNLDFTVNLSEAVIIDTTGGTPRIAVTLDTGGIVYADYVSGSGSTALTFRLAVASGQLDTNGIALDSSIAANGGTLRDGAGNDAVSALNGVASTAGILVDAVAPTVSDIQLQGDPQPSAQSVSFLVTFDGPVEQVDLSDFSLATSGGVSATISGLQQVDAQHWLVVVDNITGSGSIRLDVNSATDIADPAGNALASGFTTGATFTSQLPPVFVVAAPLVSIAPVATSEPPLQSAPLIVLTPSTTEIGGATNSGLLTLAGSNIASIGTTLIGTDPIGTTYTSYTPVRSASTERPSGNRDTGSQALPSVASPIFEAGAPLSMPLPGVTAAEQSSVQVRMLDGRPLVPWLHYDPKTGLLSGQAPRGFTGKLQIQIIVRDSKGHSSVSMVELRFSDKGNGKQGANAHDVGTEAPTPNLSSRDAQRSDRPVADAGKLGLKDQFAGQGEAGRARDASALLSALDQLAAVNSRSRSA